MDFHTLVSSVTKHSGLKIVYEHTTIVIINNISGLNIHTDNIIEDFIIIIENFRTKASLRCHKNQTHKVCQYLS